MGFKDLDFNGKIEHIIYYYKWHIVLTIVGIISAISLIYTVFIREPIQNYCGIAMYGQFVSFEKENLMQQELADLVKAPENYRISVDGYYKDESDPTVESDLAQKFNAYLYAEQYQLIVTTEKYIVGYLDDDGETFISGLAGSEALYPLAAYFTKEEIKELEDKYGLLYTTNPENNKEDAFAIKADKSSILKKYNLFENETPYIAFVPQPSTYTERTMTTLQELLK